MYFEPLNPVAKEQCIKKLLLLNILVHIVTASKNSVTMSSRVYVQWFEEDFLRYLQNWKKGADDKG